MMLANDLKTYYDEVRRYLDCPKDEQDRLLLSVNKQVIELQVDNPNLDYDGIVEFLGEPESLAASLMERLSPDVVQKFKKKKRRLRLSIIACVAVVVVALSTLTIYTTTRQSNVHITEENYTFVDDNKVDDNKNVLDVENAVSNGVWIATVALKAYFTYNGITAGVTGTEYSKSLASGWSYTNHKITATNVSSSSGGTATLTATLKDFPINVPVRLSLHCAPNGTISKG